MTVVEFAVAIGYLLFLFLVACFWVYEEEDENDPSLE